MDGDRRDDQLAGNSIIVALLTSVTRLTTSSEREGEAEGVSPLEDERARPKAREKRVKNPNPRVAGPE